MSTINKTCAYGTNDLIHFRVVNRYFTHLRIRYPRVMPDDRTCFLNHLHDRFFTIDHNKGDNIKSFSIGLAYGNTILDFFDTYCTLDGCNNAIMALV